MKKLYRLLAAVFISTMVGVVLLIIANFSACGKPVTQQLLDIEPVADDEKPVPVIGTVSFGSQCPYGTVSPLVPLPLNLWDCPVGLNALELITPLRPLVLQVDCKKKVISARSENRELDTAWEIMPDGSFYFTIDGGTARVKNDGAGNNNCSIPLSADMWGKVDCSDRDKVNINIEAMWWFGKKEPSPTTSPSPVISPSPSISPPPSPSPSPTSSLPSPRPTVTQPPRRSFNISAVYNVANVECKIPKSCFLYTSAIIRQCE
ncbi:MAG: hypothetical protein AAB116_01380 [Candidatus Poribacteria bacterium]